MTCHLILKQLFVEEPIIKHRNPKRKGDPIQSFNTKKI